MHGMQDASKGKRAQKQPKTPKSKPAKEPATACKAGRAVKGSAAEANGTASPGEDLIVMAKIV